MEFEKLVKERHSARKFKLKQPDWRDILKAIDSALKAPLAGNIPTLKFILVSDKEKIQALSEAAAQDFIATSHYVVVVCSSPSQLIRSYDERGAIYTRQQAGAAIENFLLKITELKLSTCWVGAFSEATVKSLLQIPEEVQVEAIFPIGYEMPPLNKQRKKPDLNSSLYFNVYNNKYMSPIRKATS